MSSSFFSSLALARTITVPYTLPRERVILHVRYLFQGLSLRELKSKKSRSHDNTTIIVLVSSSCPTSINYEFIPLEMEQRNQNHSIIF